MGTDKKDFSKSTHAINSKKISMPSLGKFLNANEDIEQKQIETSVTEEEKIEKKDIDKVELEENFEDKAELTNQTLDNLELLRKKVINKRSSYSTSLSADAISKLNKIALAFNINHNNVLENCIEIAFNLNQKEILKTLKKKLL